MRSLTLVIETIFLLPIIPIEILQFVLAWYGIGLFKVPYLLANCLIFILNAANNKVVNGDNQLKIA